MLRTTLPLALLLAAAIPATAQDGHRHGERERKSPEQRAEMHTSRMQEQLKLDDVQAEKVAEINLRFAEQMEAVRAARKAEQEGMKEKAPGTERFPRYRAEGRALRGAVHPHAGAARAAHEGDEGAPLHAQAGARALTRIP